MDLPLCLVFFFLYFLQKVRGTHNTETPGCNILARFDPRPAGVHVGGRGVRGGGVGTMSQQYLEYFCPSSLLETSESDLYAGMGRFMGTGGVGGGGGLFSYSGG